jgi:radical SAM superfamily enzyme YgiQ (UPF0313 family)
MKNKIKNKMKIMLIIPNSPPRIDIPRFIPFDNENPEGQFEPPIGILYIASVLEKAGHEVEIIDNFIKKIPNEKLIKIILEKNPDIVGFSLYITNYKSASEIMKEIKKKNKKIKTVSGGPYATVDPEKFIKDKNADFVIIGEGEYSLLEIADRIKNNNLKGKIPGVYYRKAGKILRGPPREFIKNLDELPYPAWHLVDINNYYRNKTVYLDVKPVDIICSSRGCPYNCAFCSSRIIWKRNYRHRSAKSICDEIEYMMKKYGTKGIHFREDNFTVSKNKVLDFCNEILRRKIKIYWQCESRVDTLDEEVVRKMAQAGCRGIWYGLESGSQKILNKLNKGITLEQIRKAVNLCKKYKITTGGSFMFGLPFETKKDIRKTFEFAKSLKLDSTSFSKYIGYPHSVVYDYAKKNKLYRDEWEQILVIETPEFSAEELEKMDIWFREYFRMRKIRRICSHSSL